jgi:hypothetical protein
MRLQDQQMSYPLAHASKCILAYAVRLQSSQGEDLGISSEQLRAPHQRPRGDRHAILDPCKL